MISPTGLGIRNDPAGQGIWGASRGERPHMGVDFLCIPGQKIKAPLNMEIYRRSNPYADNPNYTGIAWRTDIMEGRMFYFAPLGISVGGQVKEGQHIGYAQDISDMYFETAMEPHIHFEIKSIDPVVIMELINSMQKFN